MRTAVKAVIPHVDDHVSKLQSLGVMTQNKLADIGAAAAAAGITYELNVPKNCVGTGKLAQFTVTWQSLMVGNEQAQVCRMVMPSANCLCPAEKPSCFSSHHSGFDMRKCH